MGTGTGRGCGRGNNSNNWAGCGSNHSRNFLFQTNGLEILLYLLSGWWPNPQGYGNKLRLSEETSVGLMLIALTVPSLAFVAAQLSLQVLTGTVGASPRVLPWRGFAVAGELRSLVPSPTPSVEHGPCRHARATGADRQKRCVPAGEGARPFPGHPCSIMTLQVSNSASGDTEMQGEEGEGCIVHLCNAVSETAIFLQRKDYYCKIKVTFPNRKFAYAFGG